MKIAILFLMITTSVLGQTVDYNKIILPESSQATDFEEKLVQLAWRNHPSNEALRRQVNIAGYNVKQSNASWLENIRISGNLNQFNLDKRADALSDYRSSFYPLYNFGVTFTLGSFFTTPYTIKKSREELIISQANVNSQKLLVRNAVLRLYNEYLMQERIYKLQSQTLLDNETAHKLAEQRFRQGEITFETYSVSLAAYNEAMRAQLQAERDFKNAKLDLEQWIGIRLEDVR
jgi:outer membrane protein TolC